jgi:site-specific DNA recombinase
VLMAKAFIDNLSEEVRKGMLEKAEQGKYPSGAPYGYKNIRLEDGKGVIVIDPEAAANVRKMFELYATGSYSLLTLRKKMLADGMIYRKGKSFYISTLETILKNEFYIGVFHWKGKRYENAQHEPLISRELFLQVQNTLRNPRKSKSKKGMFPFSNLLSCGVCGCALTTELQKGKYIYYRCTGYRGKCGQPYLKQEVFEQYFESLLSNIHVSDATQELILQGLRESMKDKIEYHDNLVQQLNRQINVLQKRSDQAYLDKLDGTISDTFWKQNSSKWLEEKEDLTAKLLAAQKADTNYLDSATIILELAKRAAELFKSRPGDQKRRMVNLLVLNCSYKDKKIDVVLKPVFQELLVSSMAGNWCARQDSNLRPAD